MCVYGPAEAVPGQAGTTTLQRSDRVEFCTWLSERGEDLALCRSGDRVTHAPDRWCEMNLARDTLLAGEIRRSDDQEASRS